MENRCVCCGSIIPEGRQVCRECEEDGGELYAEQKGGYGNLSKVNVEINGMPVHGQHSSEKWDKSIDPCEYIADHYGVKSQINQCIEELSELIQALCKYKRKYNSDVPNYEDSEELKHIAEELTDVGIMSEQLLYLLKIPEKEITKIAKDKMLRQIIRIRHE